LKQNRHLAYDTILYDICHYIEKKEAMPELQLVKSTSINTQAQTEAGELLAMQKAMVRLFEKWDLTDEQASILLGDISIRSYQRWKSGKYGKVKVDLASRMSNLLGIHKSLRILFIDPKRGYAWIKKPNLDFGGVSARDVMLRGELTDLMRVRHYLDSVRT